MKTHAITFLICAVLPAARLSPAQTTITVGPGGGHDHATIQAAIDSATTGDTIVVHPGTYIENIHFLGKSVVLRSTELTNPSVVATTIIDGASTATVVTFAGTETSGCLLSGVTIRNGSYPAGGGIRGNSTRATISNNTITSNSAETGGALSGCDGLIENNTVTNNNAGLGDVVFSCGGTIRGNTISDNVGHGLGFCNGTVQNNTISGNSGRGLILCHGPILNNTISDNLGGGLHGCNGPIQGNVITHNRAEDGGGLSFCHGSFPNNAIQNNTISGNIARNRGGGLYDCSGLIQNNTIADNSAGSSGGGLSGCGDVIQYNTISGNSAGGEGGGLSGCGRVIRYNRITGNSAVSGGGLADCLYTTIRNNLIAGNAASQAGGGLASCSGTIENVTISGNSAGDGGGASDCDATIVDCIVWGNTATTGSAQLADCTTPTYSCIEGWTGGGQGNIAADPLFVDPDGPDDDPATHEDNDYHLSPGSPCIDTGTIVYLTGWPIHDLDGNCRAINAALDMGCYEFGSGPDADGDLLSDADEAARGTDPDDVDTDGDHLVDGLELFRGSDPAVITPPGVFHIPADYASIQEAIYWAVAGDELIVSPGVYVESIRFAGRNVTLRSTKADNPQVVAATILEGTGYEPVVTFAGSETSSCVLTGFTIRNGWGIMGNGCYALIARNTFTSNSGGAIYECHGTIRNNLITGNGGGGIHDCHGTIRNNLISDNWGGGITRCNGTIVSNVITENAANHGGGLSACNGIIQNNTIAYNSAEMWCGGPWMWWPCGTGGGLHECTGTIRNNIVVNNSANYAGDNLYGCSQPTYSCIEGWTAGGEGNIGVDPLFVDPDGPDNDPDTYADNDYRLAPGSPCIDAGNPHPAYNDGARPPGLGTERNDMGAYGGPYNGGWLSTPSVPQTLTVGPGGGYDFARIQAAIDAATTGDTVLVHPGTYVENIHFKGKNIILRSVGPTDPATVAATIIDGNSSGSVVTFSGTETDRCRLEGFTIRNGRAQAGAGVNGGAESQRTGASICWNRIEANSATAAWPELGGGVAYCDGRIEANIVTSNTATFGAGVAKCGGDIRNNAIFENHAKNPRVLLGGGSLGGGLYDCDGIIGNNLVAGNTVWALTYASPPGDMRHTGYGGGLAACGGAIRNNLVVANSANGRGGGMWDADGMIANNTIAANTASLGSALDRCRGWIANCVLWSNTNSRDPSPLHDCVIPTYSCIDGWTSGGLGNFAADPLFVDLDGLDGDPLTVFDNDYRLSPASPCIDAGNPDPAHNDAERPPGLRSERNDVGAYGGPYNGGWLVAGLLRPDLAGSLSSVGPSPLIAGRPIALAGSVVNDGDWPAFAYCWVEFWAIDRQAGARVMLCDSLYMEPLAAGRAIDLAAMPPRFVYDTIPPGVYAIEMRIDALDAVSELNETNNVAGWGTVAILPDRPNLTVRDFDFAPQDVSPTGGDSIRLSVTIENAGSRPTTGSFWVEFRVSDGLPFDPAGAYLCDSLPVAQTLSPGESMNVGSLSRATYSLPPGVYTVGVVVDPLNEIAEQREDDNVTWLTRKKLYIGARPTGSRGWLKYR